MANVIEVTGLTRRFGPVLAVDGANLRVPMGSIYGFLGPNGAGKTTTIRILLGLLTAQSGEVRLFGRKMPEQRLAALRRVGALVRLPRCAALWRSSGWRRTRIAWCADTRRA